MKSKQFYNTTAWKWFSKYIKLYHAKETSEGLMCQCVTSGRWYKCNDRRLHAGHFQKVYDSGGQTNFSTAFDFENVLPQSSSDNRYAGGKPDKMAQVIESKFGKGTVERLRIRSKNFLKLDKWYLDLIAKEYKQKFKELALKKGNPWAKK